MEANTTLKQDTQMQKEKSLEVEDEDEARSAAGGEGLKKPPLADGVELVSVYNVPFPLPEQTIPELCRDEYLKNILLPYRTVVEKRKRTEDSIELLFPDDDGPEKTPEALAIKRMIRQTRLWSAHRSQVVSIIKRRTVRLYEFALECQKASVDFMLPRLRKQLGLFSNPWPGEINEMPNNLFNWSVDYFMQRLHVNQLYLDVIQRERSTSDLDCIKFRTDLHEMVSLLQEVRDDFIDGRDICKYSMTLIHDAKYITNSDWINDINKARQLQEELQYNTFTNHSSRNYRRTTIDRQSNLKIEFEHEQAVGPIDLRYRINWMHSCIDQKLMKLKGKEDLLEKELNEVRTHMKQDALVHNTVELVIANLSASFKTKIREWEEKLETDLENVELLCNHTSNNLQKVKDDLVFYKEQQEMYKQRIIEVKAQIEQEEQERIQEMERRAFSLPQKSLQKQKRQSKNKKKKF
ncbi:uncharacterized protein LOC117582299 [Drosophila guanche]|uniref:Uncharacterized protein n=1 Tax=Drosophila guanche TaxID=7266 RepID=A0A3B0JZ85_DROGU|nr:uncharacterized protein LOC117582299 [Drosophila guanche]SPP78989.1 Hypothetical predicted protein [Drosophila guanche]